MKSKVVCTNCGRENEDPGDCDLSDYRCGFCDKFQLIRIPKAEIKRDPLVDTGIGGAMGFVLIGLIGLFVGALIGYLIGKQGGK